MIEGTGTRQSKTDLKTLGISKMRRDLLKRLRCPQCKAEFDADSTGDTIEFALLYCDCTTYPVVGGIAVIRTDALTSLAVEMLHAGERERAVALLLNRRSPLPGRQLLGELGAKVQSLPPIVAKYLLISSVLDGKRRDVRDYDHFATIVDQFENDYLSKYLLYRPFEQSFWNLHAFLPFIAEHDGPILDFGGGWGHSSHLLYRVTERDLYNVEIDFRPLYVQREFLNDEVGGVVVEAGMDLPYAADTFGITLDLDGFHYVENKYGIASEYERTTRDDGSILLLHAHDRAVTDRGVPLSPTGYRDCFSRDATVVGEEDLLSGFLKGTVRLGNLPNPRTSPQDLDIVIGSRPLENLVISTADHPFEMGVGEVLVNPLYEATEHADHWSLQRKPLEEKFTTEFAFSINHTSPSYRIAKDNCVPTDLLYRGVFAPLPDTYVPGRTLDI